MRSEQLDRDIDSLASAVVSLNGTDVAAAACLVYLTETCLRHPGLVGHRNLEPLLNLQRQWLDAWLKTKNLCSSHVEAALQDIKRADQTARYLALIPA